MKISRPIILIVLILSVVLVGCYSLAEDITPPANYTPQTAQDVPPTEVMYFPLMAPNPAAGAAIFAESCLPCHGERGLGDGPQANELPNPVAPIGDRVLAQERTPEDWYRAVSEGNIERYMPPFTSLSERQRWDVVAYVFTLSSSPTAVEEGGMLYQDNCTDCHGPDGQGDGVEAVNLAIPPSDFTDQALMAERSSTAIFDGILHSGQAELPSFDGVFSDSERWAMADYLRSLTFARDVETASEPETSQGETDPVETDGEPVEGVPELAGLGRVGGQVVNLSGGDVPVDLELTLYGYDQFQEVLTKTTTLKEGGQYLFEDVEMPTGRAFLVVADYQETTYTSDIAVVEADQIDISLPVSVFDTSTDGSALTVDRMHIFFEFITPDVVRVAILNLISNPTNVVIIPEAADKPVVRFSVPVEATNLQFQDGAIGRQFVETENGFGDIRNISPGIGQHQVLYSYDLPYDRGVSFQQPVDLAVGSIVLLVPDIGIRLDTGGLTETSTQDVEGTPYKIYSGTGLSAGSALEVSLSGRPTLGTESTAGGGSTNSLFIGLVGLGVTMLGAGAYLFIRQRVQGEAGFEEEPLLDELPAHLELMDSAELMDAIIALDDRFKTGDLPENAYLRQRGVIKARLKDILARDG